MSARRNLALAGWSGALAARLVDRLVLGPIVALVVWPILLAMGIGLAGCEAEQAGQAEQAEKAVPAELRDACKAVAERVVVLTQEALVRLPDRERALVDSQLGQVRDQYATVCMDEAWPAAVRDCMRGAGTREAFAQCAPARGR
jgi:hypothetical protein